MVNDKFYLEMQKLKPEDFITGNNFARNSDVVYAEAISVSDTEKLEKNNLNYYEIIDKNVCIYSIKEFQLSENDIIFCKTDFLFDLFSQLKNIRKLKNIKLITHQAATPAIDKKLFYLKPKCISEWYSINVDYNKAGLIPIPLGLANNFSDGNLHPTNFLNCYFNYLNDEKINKIYCNFNLKNNPKRNEYFEFAKTNKVFKTITKIKENSDFINDLFKYEFILTPSGVGKDTHRFWETLYAGSTPIAENDQIYNDFFHENYKSFNAIQELGTEFINVQLSKDSLPKKLNINFWISKINNNKRTSNEVVFIKFDQLKMEKNKKAYVKKYTRYKILNSNFSIKIKIKDYVKTFKNIESKLEKIYWN